MTPVVLSSSGITGTNVYNAKGDSLGEIKDLMINTQNGTISYAVLSFGGFLGLGDKYFAIPWESFTIDAANEKFVLNLSKEKLENAPGFDKENWPSDATYIDSVYTHYGYKPYSTRRFAEAV